MRIAINGLGRIGRVLFRRLIQDPEIEIVAVNDIMPVENLVYLLKYDSIYGPFGQKIDIDQDHILVEGKKIRVCQNPDPSQLPWKELKVDVVLECTGSFTSESGASKHLLAGSKKVLLSTTGGDDIPLRIYGFNQNEPAGNIDILSPGGCMTNCSTHILALFDTIGIQSIHINIIHSYTSRQALVDMPHAQFRRGRAAGESIIPVAIDLDRSLKRLFPLLAEKINVYSTRVPVANGAMAFFTAQLKSDISRNELNAMFRAASEKDYSGIMDYTEDSIVSLDIKGNSNSCIVDGTQTAIIGNHVQVVAWFDNEYGFTSRMIDWLHYWNKH